MLCAEKKGKNFLETHPPNNPKKKQPPKPPPPPPTQPNDGGGFKETKIKVGRMFRACSLPNGSADGPMPKSSGTTNVKTKEGVHIVLNS